MASETSTYAIQLRGPDEQLPGNYRVDESDSQAFVVANCRPEDVRIAGRIAGLTVVEVDADEVHLA